MTKLIVTLLGLLAVAAFFTKPSEGEVDRLLRERLAAEIESGAGVDADNSGGQLLLTLCKSNRAACVDLLRQFVSLGVEDELFYTRIEAQWPGRDKVTCIGALTRVMCPAILQD